VGLAFGLFLACLFAFRYQGWQWTKGWSRYLSVSSMSSYFHRTPQILCIIFTRPSSPCVLTSIKIRGVAFRNSPTVTVHFVVTHVPPKLGAQVQYWTFCTMSMNSILLNRGLPGFILLRGYRMRTPVSLHTFIVNFLFTIVVLFRQVFILSSVITPCYIDAHQ